MKIYIWHTKKFDYINELYKPLEDSELIKNHEIILPHIESDELFNSKEYLKSCDLMIADISYPSTSLGIEIWWANLYWCKVVCVYKKWTKISKGLETVCNTFFEYGDYSEIVGIIWKIINI